MASQPAMNGIETRGVANINNGGYPHVDSGDVCVH
jgi:hypothetical protein